MELPDAKKWQIQKCNKRIKYGGNNTGIHPRNNQKLWMLDWNWSFPITLLKLINDEQERLKQMVQYFFFLRILNIAFNHSWQTSSNLQNVNLYIQKDLMRSETLPPCYSFSSVSGNLKSLLQISSKGILWTIFKEEPEAKEIDSITKKKRKKKKGWIIKQFYCSKES